MDRCSRFEFPNNLQFFPQTIIFNRRKLEQVGCDSAYERRLCSRRDDLTNNEWALADDHQLANFWAAENRSHAGNVHFRGECELSHTVTTAHDRKWRFLDFRRPQRRPPYVSDGGKGSLDGQSVSGGTGLQKGLQPRTLVLNNMCLWAASNQFGLLWIDGLADAVRRYLCAAEGQPLCLLAAAKLPGLSVKDRHRLRIQVTTHIPSGVLLMSNVRERHFARVCVLTVCKSSRNVLALAN